MPVEDIAGAGHDDNEGRLTTETDRAMQGKALWYVGAGRAELREETVADPGAGDVLVRALFGAVSRGTERLVFSGNVPASEHQRMRAPFMAGAFPFPVKYGYATVGRIEAGSPELRGATVFTLHPHQSVFTLPARAVFPVSGDIPPSRAVLAANMETALNAVWDGAPGPADRVAIVGGGLVGLLVAYLCARLAGAQVTVVDILPSRGELARAIGARFATPDAAPTECDLVFHASASAAGLATALRLAGEEATIVELSWYGSGDIAAPLGEAFHSRRLKLVSSQVGQIAPSHRPRWTHARRLAAAIALTADPALDALVAPALAFEQLPTSLPSIFSPESGIVCQLIRYPAADAALDMIRSLSDHGLGLVFEHFPKTGSHFSGSCSSREVVRVRSRSIRPDHDRAFVPRRGVRPRPKGAWRHLRHPRGVPGRDARRARHRGRHRARPRGAQGRARPAQLPQSRRGAAVQGLQHDDRVPDQVSVRSLAEAARGGELGRDGNELSAIRVTIAESPVARAWYEASLW